MTKVKNKAVALLMTAALLVSVLLQTGCISEARDIAKIEEITGQFIEAFAAGDSDDVEELIDGDFSYGYSDKDKAEILLMMASKTQIESFKSVEINRERKTAKARIKISYIDVFEFSRDHANTFMSKDEYMEAVEDYDDLSTAHLSLNFVFDDDEGKWLIKEASAEKYKELFRSDYWIELAMISAEEARDAFEGIIGGLAQGNLEQEYFSLSLDDIRLFEDESENNDVINEAALEFTKAYYKYIEEHYVYVNIPDDYPYKALISGKAPSTVQILDYFSTDEYVTEMCMAFIRDDYVSSMTEDEIWSRFFADIYYSLAEQIPYMDSEDYIVTFHIDPEKADPMIYTEDRVFPIYPDQVERAYQMTDAKYYECYQKAAESLYHAGEISKKDYDSILKEIENTRNTENNPSGNNSAPGNYINWAGTANYANQAVNTHEYVPEWSDGSLVYGASEVDRQGIYMHYSKEPGWLNTAGYHIGLEGITVLVTFDHKFAKGTRLEYDWYINDEQYGDSVSFTVQEDGTVEFEFTLSDTEISRYGTCELRLWEEGHRHVISYVSLTQT